MTFLVDQAHDGVLLRSFLKGTCSVSSRMLTRLKQMPDGIRVNGLHSTVRTILKAGDVVEISSEDLIPQDVFPPEQAETPVRVLYEDDCLLLVSKPPFMPTHPSRRHYSETLGNAVSFLYSKSGRPFVFRPVNRLDRNTSGIVMLAKDQWTASVLCRMMKNHEIRKTYYALTDGVPDPPEGRMDGWIRRRTPGIVIRECCLESDDGAESVRTAYETVASGSGHALVRLMPETGRTHQLRVQLASLGCPVTGDGLYGADSSCIPRQALHAAVLEWTHPVTGKMMTVTDPLPEDMRTLCDTWFPGLASDQIF